MVWASNSKVLCNITVDGRVVMVTTIEKMLDILFSQVLLLLLMMTSMMMESRWKIKEMVLVTSTSIGAHCHSIVKKKRTI